MRELFKLTRKPCPPSRRSSMCFISSDNDNDTAISDDVAYMTFNAKHLPKDAGIKVSNSGGSFKASNITTTSLLHCIFIHLACKNIQPIYLVFVNNLNKTAA